MRCPVWPDWCGFGGVKIGQGFGDGAIIFTRIRRVEFSARFCGAMGRGAHLALGDVVHVDRERPQGVLGVRPLRRIVPVIQDIAQLLQLRKGLHRELLACSPLTLLPRQIRADALPPGSFPCIHPDRPLTRSPVSSRLRRLFRRPRPEHRCHYAPSRALRSAAALDGRKTQKRLNPLAAKLPTEQTRAALKLPRQIARPRRARQSGRGGYRAR